MKCCYWFILNNLLSNYYTFVHSSYKTIFTDILNSISAWHSTWCFIMKPTLHLILAAKYLTMGLNILLSGILILMHLYFHETFSRNFSWKYRCCFRNYVNQLCSGGVGMKQCVKKMERLSSCPNLYIPSTIKIWKKVLTKAIWADKKWAGFWQNSLYIK